MAGALTGMPGVNASCRSMAGESVAGRARWLPCCELATARDIILHLIQYHITSYLYLYYICSQGPGTPMLAWLGGLQACAIALLLDSVCMQEKNS